MRIRRNLLRKSLVIVASATMLVATTGVATVLAVHDLAFQLDGDVSAGTTTNIGTNGPQTVDWSSVFDASGAAVNPLPTGFTKADLTKDFNVNSDGSFNTSDTSTYTTGSKDTLPISTGWQCTYSNNVNSKIDVMNAYAAAYTAANGDKVMYFALERNTNTGDANVAFWFLQDNVGCATSGSAADFTGQHHDGDILIVSAFTKGGDVSTVNAYRWNGDDTTGSLGTVPIAGGGDCRSSTQGTDDAICAAANDTANGTNGTITTPWMTANFKDGVGHTLRTGEFFEGGINLTKTNLANKCFNTFLGDTRSSQSLTATLFDYAGGTIGECTSTTTTTPVDATDNTQAPATSIPAAPADAKVTVQDKAVLSVSGVASFNGSMSFHICGPTDPTSTATCDSGGVDLGSVVAQASGTYYSPPATVTAAGRYCFRGDFSGDSSIGVPASSDHSSGECFTVAPLTPTLLTQAGAGPVDFGQPVTDTATLGGTANEPGTGGPTGDSGSINPATLGGPAQGTITFTLYKSDCTTAATGTGTNPQTVTVSGNGTYGPVSFTPDSPGTYHWVATYSGDLPNTKATDHNKSCDDTNEDVIVRQIPTTISTAQKVYPQDSATVSSSISGNKLPAGGTVTFRLYDTLTACQAHGTTVGSGGLLYSEAKTIASAADSVTLGTANSSVALDANGTYYWWVTYATGDTAHTGSQSDCAESTQTTFVNDAGPGTLFP